MTEDDPTKPEFKSLSSYSDFARNVRHRSRFVWDAPISNFLETVKATIRDRDLELPKDMCLYRASIGIDWRPICDDEGNELYEVESGYNSARMRPRANLATEGRANPAGLPVLYLATTEQTAISEVRPWIGSAVSVAQFTVRRNIKALDLSVGHGKSNGWQIRYLIGEAIPTAEEKETAVWTDIDNAFSRPVTRSDEGGDYAPTQILAELFKDAGYEGIVYKSQFGEKGYNIVLFDIDDALPINCAPYEVTAINVGFKECGERWYKSKDNPEPKK
jgi:RES domain-containing protein